MFEMYTQAGDIVMGIASSLLLPSMHSSQSHRLISDFP